LTHTQFKLALAWNLIEKAEKLPCSHWPLSSPLVLKNKGKLKWPLASSILQTVLLHLLHTRNKVENTSKAYGLRRGTFDWCSESYHTKSKAWSGIYRSWESSDILTKHICNRKDFFACFLWDTPE
jgi:hypothetical protein